MDKFLKERLFSTLIKYDITENKNSISVCEGDFKKYSEIYLLQNAHSSSCKLLCKI